MKQKNKIKILHINSAYGRGGAALVMARLSEELNKTNEFNSDMLVGKIYYKKPMENISILTGELEYYMNIMINRVLGIDSIWYPFDHSKNIEKIISNYDIIHLHNLHGYYFKLKYLDLLKEKKVVWSIHDYWPLTGKCCTPGVCRKWQSGCGECPNLDYYPKSIFFDLTAKNCNLKRAAINKLKDIFVVPVSYSLENKMRNMQINTKYMEVIHNGVDSGIFKPVNNNLFNGKSKKRKILILATKINDKNKGIIGLLAKGLSSLSDTEKKKYHLMIVGEVNYSMLKKAFSGFEYTSYGYVDNISELVKIYSQADIFVNPSLSEAFGGANIEANLCGTPVIAFKYDIMEEIIQDKNLLVPLEGDLAISLVRKIRDYFEKYINYAEYSRENIRKRALSYSLKKMADKYMGIYERLLCNE